MAPIEIQDETEELKVESNAQYGQDETTQGNERAPEVADAAPPPQQNDAQVRQAKNGKEHNAFKIIFPNAALAAIPVIKGDLKKNHGCHYNSAWEKFTCPIGNKPAVEKFLSEKGIKGVSLIDTTDEHFEKNKNSKKADGILTRVYLLEKEHQEEEKKLLIARGSLSKAIKEDKLKEDDPHAIEQLKAINDSEQKQREKQEEIDQIRNSARLLESHRENESSLPEIEIKPGEIHDLTNQAEKLLEENDSGIYQRGGQLVRIVTEKTKPNKDKKSKEGNHLLKRSGEALLIAEADPTHICELLGKLAKWVRHDERTNELKQKDCPEKVAKTLISRREWDLAVLTGIIQAPTLRKDGSILEKPGYDNETGLFFNPGKTTFLPVPHSPSKEDAINAYKKLSEILTGFPFEGEESKSVALSGILTGLIRKSIRTAPFHGYTAPKMGTGKSLLADIVGLIATGQTNTVIPHAENEAEEKKRLLAVLSEGDPIICFDNIERPFGSAALCSVLTQENFKDRLLGVNRSLSVPTNATFLATGNNLTFIGDISTRAILCRLDPQCEKPEERSFEVDLKKYIPENRGELVQAALTILRAYHFAGRPKQKIPQFGRFEDWSDWVRSALVWVGAVDPCASRKEIENADPVRVALGSLLASWFAAIGDLSFTVKALIEKAKDHPELLEILKEIAPDNRGNGINSRSLGNKIASFKGRIENGYRLDSTGIHHHATTWRVTKVKLGS